MEENLDNNLKKPDDITQELSVEENVFNYKSDLTDLGNEIAHIVSKYFDEERPGYTKEDFMSGLAHGFSVIENKYFKEDD